VDCENYPRAASRSGSSALSITLRRSVLRKKYDIIWLFCTRLIDNSNLSEKGVGYAQEEIAPEQLLAMLCQIEISIAQRRSVSLVCPNAEFRT